MFEESAHVGAAPIDRYVVQEYLAEGGMGAIYLGKKLGAGGFEKQVVLKQLLPEFTQQPEFIDLFLREARLSATLDHANIIRTIDLVTAGEEYFIVMEFLDGADLRTLLKRSKLRKHRFDPAAGIYVAREILSALSYAHSKLSLDGKPLRLIHRDISPSNILISQQGEVKLTDFGIAKASTHNSVFYRVKGKVGYMSPEQARSEDLDARSDLYSLAVCLYEMITGERLFVQVGLTTSAEEMYSQPIPLVSRKVPGLPAALDQVMLKALSVDRDHRYQTAGEFQEALLRVAHRHGLMCSAPELADHLRDVAGDPNYWRELELEEEMVEAGTEIYEPEDEDHDEDHGTLRLEVDELDDDDYGGDADYSEDLGFGGEMYSAIFDLDAIVDEDERRKRRALTSVTHLGELQGMELTSMINVADVRDAGSEPLVDLDAFGTIDLEPSSGRMMTIGAEQAVEIADQQMREALRAPSAPAPIARAPSVAPMVPVVSESSESVDLPAHEEVDVRAAMAPSRRPGIVLVLLILLGAGVAAAIGLSGPEIPSIENAGEP